MKLNFNRAVAGFLIIIFISSLAFLSFNDFWQDELYSLENFIFVDPATTLTDYSNTNNHILYNLLFNFYLNLLPGVGMKEVLKHPILVRGALFVLTVVTAWLFWILSAKLYGKRTGNIIAIIFLTSITVIHFGVQARGYILSLFIAVLQYYYFIKLIRSRYYQRKILPLFLLFSFLNMMVLPTNIYLSAAYASIIFVYGAMELKQTSKKGDKHDLIKWLISGISFLVVISTSVMYYLILYSYQPADHYIENYRLFKLENLFEALLIFYHFADYRIIIWLLVAVVIGLRFIITKKRKDIIPVEVWTSGLLFFLPFIFYFVHGTISVPRTFIPLLPLFCIFTGIFISAWLELLPRGTESFLLTSSVLAFIFAIIQTRVAILKSNQESIHYHGLKLHYYIQSFNALEATEKAKALSVETGRKIGVADKFGQTGLYFYFRIFNIPYYPVAETIYADGIYVVNNKKWFELLLKEANLPYKKLYPDTKQYNIYLVGTNKNLN